MEDDPPSALIIVFDMTQAGWERSAQANGPSAVEAAESLLTFVRAFFLLHGGNSVVVIATHPHGSEYLYQSPVHAASGAEVTGVLEMDSFDEKLHAAIVAMARRLESTQGGEIPRLSSALAMAACGGSIRIARKSSVACLWGACLTAWLATASHRMNADRFRRTLPRVLVLSPAMDLPSQYVPVMNCIFSFQKAGVLVDSLVVAPGDCALLQQAADITLGAYLRPDLASLREEGGEPFSYTRMSALTSVGGCAATDVHVHIIMIVTRARTNVDTALLAFLMSYFLADRHTRYIDVESDARTTFLRLPRPEVVDYRASCFKTV